MTSASDIVKAQPFLKWAGGKGQLLEQFEKYLPSEPMRGYYEPFVGSGAVFFHLRPRDLFEHYDLSDVNPELITCYKVIRDQVDQLIDRLAEHKAKHNVDAQEYYYYVREMDRAEDWVEQPDVVRAARMIYLNKTCYNGLWRVNSKGHFNVPIGRYKNPDVLNETRLRAASEALQGVELSVRDFEEVIKLAQPEDFVYFDPPYFPLSSTSNFTSYSPNDFGEWEQKKLHLVYSELAQHGCKVMLSNSDTPFINELYSSYRIERVLARRAINSASKKRGQITEVLVLNY